MDPKISQQIEEIYISAVNLNYQEKPTFKLSVTEDYLKEFVENKAIMSDAGFATLLTVILVLLCIVSIGLFFKFRKPREPEQLTETEERFLALLKIRKNLRRAEKAVTKDHQRINLLKE